MAAARCLLGKVYDRELAEHDPQRGDRPSRSDEIRRVIQEYIDDQREVLREAAPDVELKGCSAFGTNAKASRAGAFTQDLARLMASMSEGVYLGVPVVVVVSAGVPVRRCSRRSVRPVRRCSRRSCRPVRRS